MEREGWSVLVRAMLANWAPQQTTVTARRSQRPKVP